MVNRAAAARVRTRKFPQRPECMKVRQTLIKPAELAGANSVLVVLLSFKLDRYGVLKSVNMLPHP
jgi:hypothetical protein